MVLILIELTRTAGPLSCRFLYYVLSLFGFKSVFVRSVVNKIRIVSAVSYSAIDGRLFTVLVQ